MPKPPPPLFLGRASYRQRRLRDALRLLPVAGAVGCMIPLLWPRGAEGPGNGVALLYLFGVWAGLIVTAFILSRALRPEDDSAAAEGE